jgi:hypothetical protein
VMTLRGDLAFLGVTYGENAGTRSSRDITVYSNELGGYFAKGFAAASLAATDESGGKLWLDRMSLVLGHTGVEGFSKERAGW